MNSKFMNKHGVAAMFNLQSLLAIFGLLAVGFLVISAASGDGTQAAISQLTGGPSAEPTEGLEGLQVVGTTDLSATRTISLDSRREFRASQTAAIDTVWYHRVKDGNGIWISDDIDGQNASPSLTLSANEEWEALLYNGTTYYGQILDGDAPRDTADLPMGVQLGQIDTSLSFKVINEDDNQLNAAGQRQSVSASDAETICGSYKAGADQVWGGPEGSSPIMCAVYNGTEYKFVRESRQNVAGIPSSIADLNPLAGSNSNEKRCYFIDRSVDNQDTDFCFDYELESGATATSVGANITLYFVDTNVYLNSDTNRPAGPAVEDNDHNQLGEATDQTFLFHVD